MFLQFYNYMQAAAKGEAFFILQLAVVPFRLVFVWLPKLLCRNKIADKADYFAKKVFYFACFLRYNTNNAEGGRE